MKQTKNILYIFLTLALLAACQEKFPYLHPLTLSTASVTMPAAGGRHVIMVYTEGEWTAEMSGQVNWASIENISGTGMGGVVFNCVENKGMSRSVDVIVHSGEHADTIVMNQAAGVSSPSVSFERSTVRIPAAALRVSVGFNKNIDDLSVCSSWEIVDGLGQQVSWITDVAVSKDSMSFNVGATNVQRNAVITLTAVNLVDESKNAVARLTLTQTTENPYLLPVSWVQEEPFPAVADTVRLALNTNLTYSMNEIMPTVRLSESWAELLLETPLDRNNMVVVLSENTSAEDRCCLVEVPYCDLAGNSFPFTFKFTQSGKK